MFVCVRERKKKGVEGGGGGEKRNRGTQDSVPICKVGRIEAAIGNPCFFSYTPKNNIGSKKSDPVVRACGRSGGHY